MFKRSVDLIFAICGIGFFLPVALFVALLVFMEDRQSVFFQQNRVGKNKKAFKILKFRTFQNGKVTRVGKYLRKTGLDEIPQFYNILMGQMSVVGPRPLTTTDVLRLGWNTKEYNARWSVLPGVTGLAQLYAGKGKKHSWFYDKQYFKHKNLILDLQIIVVSFFMNIFNKYRVRRWLNMRRNKSKHNWLKWQLLFEKRCTRDVPHIQKSACYNTLPGSLAKSLAIFQLGESGGGTIVQQVKQSNIAIINANYCNAMHLFVGEEHRHAEILKRCVLALNGKAIQHNWTDKLFVMSRRLMGLRLKVMVLLAAEIVGICYYRLIATRIPESEVRVCLHAILKDEQSHLAFHCEFLRTQTNNWFTKCLFSVCWYSITTLALIVVFLDHRKAIKDLNLSPFLVFKRWIRHVAMANELVVSQMPRYSHLSLIDQRYI